MFLGERTLAYVENLFAFHLFELSFAQLFEIAIFTMRFNSGL